MQGFDVASSPARIFSTSDSQSAAEAGTLKGGKRSSALSSAMMHPIRYGEQTRGDAFTPAPQSPAATRDSWLLVRS